MQGDLEIKVIAGVQQVVKRICTGCNLPFWQALPNEYRNEQCTDCVFKNRTAKMKRDALLGHTAGRIP